MGLFEEKIRQEIITRYGSLDNYSKHTGIQGFIINQVLNKGIGDSSFKYVGAICTSLGFSMEEFYYERFPEAPSRVDTLLSNTADKVIAKTVKQITDYIAAQNKSIQDSITRENSVKTVDVTDSISQKLDLLQEKVDSIEELVNGFGDYIYDTIQDEEIDNSYDYDQSIADKISVSFEIDHATKTMIKFKEILPTEYSAAKVGDIYIPKSTLERIGWDSDKTLNVTLATIETDGENYGFTKLTEDEIPF